MSKLNFVARAVAVVLVAMGSLSVSAQSYQVANSTGGQQVAGSPIANAISVVNQIANNAQGTANNAQSTANWSSQVAQNANNVAYSAQGTANDAWNRANNAQARANYVGWYNWNYTRATAISNCMATGGNPVFCTVMADSQYPAP